MVEVRGDAGEYGKLDYVQLNVSSFDSKVTSSSSAFSSGGPLDDPDALPGQVIVAGSTKWVLANPGKSYIAYTYDYSGPMGVRGMAAGIYDLKWFDTTDGDMVIQVGVSVSSGNVTWTKPDSMGSDPAPGGAKAKPN